MNFLEKISQKFDKWTIGIYSGDSPYKLNASKGIKNPILTARDISDRKAEFVADPFIVRNKNSWYMFFEVMDRRQNKGDIGLALSSDGLHWKYQRIVLSENFHLSYPYVFFWKDNYYMVPETKDANSVRLYKAVQFPFQWRLEKSLVSGPFVDSSLVYYEDYWWMFTAEKKNSHSNTLYLFYASDLFGPWTEHPKSPILKENCQAGRPAGRLLISNGQLIRFAQDCCKNYGGMIHAFEITKLSTEDYAEKASSQNPVLKASGHGWNKSGMHTIDPHLTSENRWIACVDGNQQYSWIQYVARKYVLNPRRLFKRLVNQRQEPASYAQKAVIEEIRP